MILTKNFDLLQKQVAEHVAADQVIQKWYWKDSKGCFIGCLAHAADPAISEKLFGLPTMLQRIAENIFEGLEEAEAKAFFADLPEAVECDGKDLSCVSWAFLRETLKALPEPILERSPELAQRVQDAVDPVIKGMDLLANGKPWPDSTDASKSAVKAVAKAAAKVAATTASFVADTEIYVNAIDIAVSAAMAADAASYAACVDTNIEAVREANLAARQATTHAAFASDDYHAERRRQRDRLLRLIKEAPVVAMHGKKGEA